MEMIRKQIESKIVCIRDVNVMLDSDLAIIYQTQTKYINRAVQRNPNRFPESFAFQLTTDEFNTVRFQLGTLDKQLGRGQHRKYAPWVFTEQGVAMLSAVLNTETAIKTSVQIIEAFVALRKWAVHHAALFQRLNQVELKQARADERIDQVLSAMNTRENLPKQGVFFEGQIFDAYTFVADLIKRAKTEIILIDNYLDETVLTLMTKRKPGVSVLLFTRSISQLIQLDIEKHNGQYPPIAVHTLTESHDRFVIIDRTEVYHVGASLKDVGKKWFAFSKLDLPAELILSRLPIV